MLDFLGIGAQKAGTTWLYHHLARHPQVAFPAGKEIHFWDQQRERGADWWLGHFAEGPSGVRQGEITPAYALLDKDEIAEVARLCPRLRVFYAVRNPIERAWSAALMALKRAEMRESEASDRWFVDHFQSHGSRARGDYAGCLHRWGSIFPRERLRVIVFDDIERDPRGVLKSLTRHLEVDETFFDGLSEAVLREPRFAGPDTPLRPSLVPVLRELYAEGIDALGERIGRDLSHWKVAGGSP